MMGASGPKQAERPLLGMALRAYLRSGMPVIISTDVAKLSNLKFVRKEGTSATSIYRRNGWLTSGRPPKLNQHSVLLVGYRPGACTPTWPKRKRREAPPSLDFEDEFVFHDPGLAPYLRWSLSEMLAAECPSGHSSVSCRGAVMPVVPGGVALPLLPEQRMWAECGPKYTYGLLFIARLLGTLADAELARRLRGRAWWHGWNGGCVPGEFLVDRLKERASRQDGPLFRDPWYLFNPARIESHPSMARHLSEALGGWAFEALAVRFWSSLSLVRNEDFVDGWFWVEAQPRAIWLWDARAHALSAGDLRRATAEMTPLLLKRYLVAVIVLDEEGQSRMVSPRRSLR